VPREKLVRNPLGVDLQRFRPSDAATRAKRSAELGIPQDAFCIGSFHKDGQGWDEGMEPKLIKGPDVFVKAMEKVYKHHPVFVLLSAPARGFVKNGLDQLGVSYRHIILEDFHDVPSLYAALDLYLITSREEGGPEGVLEALASGVPLVSTKVGLAPDVVTHGEDGLLTEVEDIDGLAKQMIRLIEDRQLREKLLRNGLETIKPYDWKTIAARYYHELYAPLLAGKQ
jgi:glycosyltransferase involved in cell wall biosynthesis